MTAFSSLLLCIISSSSSISFTFILFSIVSYRFRGGNSSKSRRMARAVLKTSLCEIKREDGRRDDREEWRGREGDDAGYRRKEEEKQEESRRRIVNFVLKRQESHLSSSKTIADIPISPNTSFWLRQKSPLHPQIGLPRPVIFHSTFSVTSERSI